MEVNSDARLWDLTRRLWSVAQHVRRGTDANPRNPYTVRLLALADEHGPLRPSQVAEQLEVAPPSATRYVQGCERAGHVKVREDPADGRTYLIEITDSGREVLRTLRAELLDIMRPLVDGWSQQEITTLTGLLDRLDQAMAERQARPDAGPARKNRWRTGT